jgi:putative nucleotidyltransferase with HDIG domain
MGHAARRCWLGMRLAQEIGLPHVLQSNLYYALLMKDAGSSSVSSPLFRILGVDDIKARLDVKTRDWSQQAWESLQYALTHVRVGLLGRVRARVAAREKELDRELLRIRCDRGAILARRMGLSEATAAAIRSGDEHWNGQGSPSGLRGEEIPLLARILSLAETLGVFYTRAGRTVALDTARERDGLWFDPDLIRAADSLARRGALWADLEAANWRVVGLEPPGNPIEEGEGVVESICQAFAELADAKSPFTYRHSVGVAGTAAFVARMLDLREPEVTLLRRAALLHDLGKLAISSAILDKPGALTDKEWPALRKHAYYTYEVLRRVPGFGELSEIAGSHHEKLDGSGYFRGLKAEQLSLPARILVVADIYDALSAKRPYRDALPPEQVLQIMRKQAPHALDATCLEALMRSSGPAMSNAAGLTQLSDSVRQ